MLTAPIDCEQTGVMRMAADIRELGSSDQGYHLVHDLVGAVAHRLRVPTAWNGILYETEAPSRALRSLKGERNPVYDWDTVTVNGDHSLTVRSDALGYALDAQSGRLKMKNNYKAHQSLLRMVQAAVSNSRQERRYDPRICPTEDAASHALDIGLSLEWAWDHWTKDQHNTHDVIADCDLNVRTPRLTSSRVVDLMPYANRAARVFVTELAKAARQPRDVTHRDLVGTHPRERWNQIADWLIKSNLQGLQISDAAHAKLRSELAGIAHDRYLVVARIPVRLAEMPRKTSIARVHYAAAHRDRGAREGLDVLVRMNMHIKGTQVEWSKRRAELDPMQEMADTSGVPVEKLRAFLESNRTTAASPRSGADAPTGRPGEGRHQDTSRKPSGPSR
jgi:hypothetical protein